MTSARIMLAVVLSAAGYLRRAPRLRVSANELALAGRDPLERVMVAFHAALGAAAERNAEETLAFARQADALDREYGITSLGAGARLLAEWARLHRADPSEDTSPLRCLLDERRRRGEHWPNELACALLAELELRKGDLRAAQTDVDRGLAQVRASGQAFGHVDLLCAQARIHTERRQPAEAEASFRKALETARTQGAGLYALRAATGLGRWLLGEGRRDESVRVVKEGLGALPEQVDCADLRRAELLLGDLRSREA